MSKRFLAFALLVFSFSSQAAFLSTDWLVEGDSRVVLDTQTGLEWLKLNETRGRDLRTVTGLSQYAGWRIATEDEVILMLNNYFGAYLALANNTNQTELYDIVESYSILFGRTTSGTLTNGAYWSNTGRTNRFNAAYYGESYSTNPLTGRISFSSAAASYSHSQAGIFLVSEGGLTFSSLADPSINIASPDEPSTPNMADVNAPIGFVSLLLGLLGFRRSAGGPIRR